MPLYNNLLACSEISSGPLAKFTEVAGWYLRPAHRGMTLSSNLFRFTESILTGSPLLGRNPMKWQAAVCLSVGFE